MKKIFLFMVAALFFAACEKELPTDGKQRITFNVGGDFTVNTEPAKSNSITDYSNITLMRIFDYKNGSLEQQITKYTDDEDFGRPELELTPGIHHLYFVATAGTGLYFNNNHCMVFNHKVGDTFWKDVEVNVTSNMPRQVNVTLDRVVTRLRCTFTDTLTSNVASINVTPHTWYFALDYLTGKASTSFGVRTDTALTINPAHSQYNHTNVTIDLYSFSPDNNTEWLNDLYFSAKTSTGSTIGSAGITDVPFKTNRTTHLTGCLFSTNDSATIFLNTDWDTDYTGTFGL